LIFSLFTPKTISGQRLHFRVCCPAYRALFVR